MAVVAGLGGGVGNGVGVGEPSALIAREHPLRNNAKLKSRRRIASRKRPLFNKGDDSEVSLAFMACHSAARTLCYLMQEFLLINHSKNLCTQKPAHDVSGVFLLTIHSVVHTSHFVRADFSPESFERRRNSRRAL